MVDKFNEQVWRNYVILGSGLDKHLDLILGLAWAWMRRGKCKSIVPGPGKAQSSNKHL